MLFRTPPGVVRRDGRVTTLREQTQRSPTRRVLVHFAFPSFAWAQLALRKLPPGEVGDASFAERGDTLQQIRTFKSGLFELECQVYDLVRA